ncbi:MAG TPA: twin-arginine translocase subunit TatC [Verrucomicrobiae bacterium]|nr:twin-arginine translocase subunit TatC [Verrucomicrobiae bacterium]
MDTTPDFLSHLEELRKRILVSLFVFVACTVAAYFFSRQIVNFLIEPLHKQQNAQLVFQTPYEAFLTYVKVSAVTGLLLSLPVIFFEFWKFVSPGLYDREKKVILPLSFVCVLLFLAGVCFAYFLVIPFGLGFLLSFQTESLRPLIAIAPYFSFLLGMILAFGALFDFPVVLLGLIKLGVMKTETLASMRKLIVVGIFVVAAILTPSPDPVSQLLLAIPLVLLFEITLLIAGRIEKKAPKTPQDQGIQGR